MKGEKDTVSFKCPNLHWIYWPPPSWWWTPISTATHSQHQQNTIFVLLKGYWGNKSLWKSTNQQEEKLRETKKLLLLESETAVHKQHRSHWTGITQQGQTHTAPFQGVKVKAPLLSQETSWDVQLINPSSASCHTSLQQNMLKLFKVLNNTVLNS